MNVLSLFSGIGGLDLGLQRAGFTIAGQVEIDPWCRKVLAKHWPEVPRHDDVRTAAEWWGGRRSPDLVCGGFPCQPVSLAGKGLAQADPRWLWPAFADVIRDLRPRYVFVENTPGLLGRGMGDVLGDLAGLGYDAEWDCLSAAHVGAPHLRERIWIVAYTQRGWRHGLHERQQPGHLAADPSGCRADSAGGAAAEDHRRGIPRQGPQGGDVADAGSPQGRIWTGRRQQLAEGGRGPGPSDWWATEPDVDRVAHGVPARVDRLRGLGNAVVPQVVEHIGRLILGSQEAAS